MTAQATTGTNKTVETPPKAYEQGKSKKGQTCITLFTPWGQASFARIAKPEVDKNTGKESWKTDIIFRPGEDLSWLEGAIAIVTEANFGKTFKHKKPPIKNGDIKKD